VTDRSYLSALEISILYKALYKFAFFTFFYYLNRNKHSVHEVNTSHVTTAYGLLLMLFMSLWCCCFFH